MFAMRYFAVVELDGGGGSCGATEGSHTFDEQHEFSAVFTAAAVFSSRVGAQQSTACGSAEAGLEQHELVTGSRGFICIGIAFRICLH